MSKRSKYFLQRENNLTILSFLCQGIQRIAEKEFEMTFKQWILIESFPLKICYLIGDAALVSELYWKWQIPYFFIELQEKGQESSSAGISSSWFQEMYPYNLVSPAHVYGWCNVFQRQIGDHFSSQLRIRFSSKQFFSF